MKKKQCERGSLTTGNKVGDRHDEKHQDGCFLGIGEGTTLGPQIIV